MPRHPQLRRSRRSSPLKAYTNFFCGFALVSSGFAIWWYLRRLTAGAAPAQDQSWSRDEAPADYVSRLDFERASHTLGYGDPKLLYAPGPRLSDATYHEVISGMPVVCVDVVLQRKVDHKVLLVKRNREPVRAVWWLPGGRLLKGENFFQAAERKIRGEIGIGSGVAVKKVLGVYNTLFEKSAWEGSTQTVNVLVYAVANGTAASLTRLNICGDRQGRCDDGKYGNFRWVDYKQKTGLDKYVLEALGALQFDAEHGKMLLDALRRRGYDVISKHGATVDGHLQRLRGRTKSAHVHLLPKKPRKAHRRLRRN